MTRTSRRTITWWVAAGATACVLLALKEVGAAWAQSHLDRRVFWTTVEEEVVWQTGFYLMWAAVAPLIFALGRRVPFRRDRWVFPLAFHAVAGAIIVACAPLVLNRLVDVLYYGRSIVPPLALYIQIVPPLSLYRVVNDGWWYWAILAGGLALQASDEHRAKRRRAAELERSLVAAQVDALKMKLQPHFLFNTLNSISFLAVENDTEGMVTMVERLGVLLRSSMQSNGRQLVTVAQELALLDQYLAIEEIRFADRLQVARHIDPGVTGALIPSLVLQPIIENSIKHGFSRRIDAGRLQIGVRREGETLLVTVEDDGPGLPPAWDLATHCGRGLKNVIERLDKLYPRAWGFTLKNQPAGGAIARLRIPWQEVTQ